jgi:hypothetical protein
MCDPLDYFANHVVACAALLLFFLMVLTGRLTGGTLFSSGFFRLVGLIAFAVAVFSFYVLKQGAPEQLLPGSAGTVAQGLASGKQAVDTARQQCYIGAVVKTGQQAASRRMCSTTRTPAEWEQCISGVLCSQIENGGCVLKTQCDARAEGSTPNSLLKGIARAFLAPFVGLFSCQKS